MRLPRFSAWWAFAGLALVLVLLAFARPLDHDESQYVAAAVLARSGLPYRDFAYLQTPLQPLLFAPLTAVFGAWTFPGLRLLNALLGMVTIAAIYGAARATELDRRHALSAAGLFVACDIFLFSATIARNDMLPAALFAVALWLLVGQLRGGGGAWQAMATGLLLSAATAAKLSYAFPALTVGALALIDRRYRPAWLILGALPPALLVAATWRAAPDAFVFDVLRFPSAAPEQFYAAGRAWKLALWARTLDTLKFLALGPALLALVVVVRTSRRDRLTWLLDLLIAAGLIAALLPAPTWRQYLLPVLPPLFVRLALVWRDDPPSRGWRIGLAVFVAAGLAPSIILLGESAATGLPLVAAIKDGAVIGRAMDRAGVTGPIATLSPQFVPATGRAIDPRFAAGPFYFRSDGLLAQADEARFGLVSRCHVKALDRDPPAVILVGGEGEWTSGDATLDRTLSEWADARRWPAHSVPGTPFTFYVRPR